MAGGPQRRLRRISFDCQSSLSRLSLIHRNHSAKKSLITRIRRTRGCRWWACGKPGLTREDDRDRPRFAHDKLDSRALVGLGVAAIYSPSRYAADGFPLSWVVGTRPDGGERHPAVLSTGVEGTVETAPQRLREGRRHLTQIQWSEGDVQNFHNRLKTQVGTTTWQTWMSRMGVSYDGNGTVYLTAPSEFHLRWLVEKYRPVIETAVAETFGSTVRASFEWGEVEESGAEVLPAPPAPPGVVEELARTSALAKYRFENFVVGPSNRFAWAAAMAVAEQPGSHYNPLFIYADAGLGKTHLLRAVGQHSQQLYPGLVARYVTSEQFFNEFIEGIRRKRMDDFKNRYRTTDCLLLDDVQFFEGKEQILEEFFHTFNSLYESGKQMVISCDRAPRNLATLENRLRSRFEWGLLVDIQPPDVETRLAILKRIAEFAPRPVPTDVLEYIASLVSDNIRELEGALTRVTAYAALNDLAIDRPIAERVLRDMGPGSEHKVITPVEIIRATAAVYGFTTAEVEGPSRRQPLALCRQIAMYLTRQLTDLSLPKIGHIFGGRDHTTVLHACDKINHLIRTDHEVFERVTRLSQDLRKT